MVEFILPLAHLPHNARHVFARTRSLCSPALLVVAMAPLCPLGGLVV